MVFDCHIDLLCSLVGLPVVFACMLRALHLRLDALENVLLLLISLNDRLSVKPFG